MYSYQPRFLLDRNRRGSMTTKSRSDGNAIFVQYCRACDTHSWCTHHDEAKYHDTFLKFCDLCAIHLPTFEVVGNMVPPHLIPFKIAENKYIDANTNKYVVYPQIGSFQVRFEGQTVFSKKDSHTWPNLGAIVSKINKIVDPMAPSPRIEKAIFDDKQTKKNSTINSFLDSTDEHITGTSIQPKGFTLTDHFKMYRPKNKFEDKDYLTEKQESELSCKQFSDVGPIQSREKGQKSEELIRVKDLFGETKLKQMLKTRGLMLKQQGKKQMIIKLDSIEEQNAMIEDGLAATQRTQEKNIKKNNKMQQFQDQMSSLENKFINFENRVQDIQARGREFQYKNQPSDEKAKIKHLIDSFKKEEKTFLKRQSELKDKGQFMDKTNKLEQYLNYNQDQKNQKLHRIYGEWKLIKQFSSKNRKLIKKKERPSQIQDQHQESSEDEDSQTHSQSPSNNVLTFKPKLERSLDQRSKNFVITQNKHPKYSTKEKYLSKQYPIEVKGRTDENFYQSKISGLRSKIESQQMDMQPTVTTKLVKKSINALSMDALRSMANRQGNINNSNQNGKIQIDTNNFSKNVKVDIQKISNRINNIQEQLRRHKDWKQSSPTQHTPYGNEDRLRKKSKNGSEKSSQFSSKEVFKYYGGFQQDSHNSINTSKKTLSNINSKQRFSNFSQLQQPRKNKVVQKHDSMIQEVSEPMESKQASKYQNFPQNKHKKEQNSLSKMKDKKQRSNDKLLRQRGIRIRENICRQQKSALNRKTAQDNNSPSATKERFIKKSPTNHDGPTQKAEASTTKIAKDIPSSYQQKKEVKKSHKLDDVSASEKIKQQVKKERVNLQHSKSRTIKKSTKDHRPSENKEIVNQQISYDDKIQKQMSNKLKIVKNKQIVFQPKKSKDQRLNSNSSSPKKIQTPRKGQPLEREAKMQINQGQKPIQKSQFGKIKKNNKPINSNIQQNPKQQVFQTQNQSSSMQDTHTQNNQYVEPRQQIKTTSKQTSEAKKTQTRQDIHMRKTLGYFKAEGMSYNGVRTNTERNRKHSEKTECNKQTIKDQPQLRPHTQNQKLLEQGQQLGQSNLFDNSQQYQPQQQSRQQTKQKHEESMQGEQDDEQQRELESGDEQDEIDRQEESQSSENEDNQQNQEVIQNQQNINIREKLNEVKNVDSQRDNSKQESENISLQQRVEVYRDVKYQAIEGWKLNTDQDIEDNPQFQHNSEAIRQNNQANLNKNLQDNEQGILNNKKKQTYSQQHIQKGQIVDKCTSQPNIHNTVYQKQNLSTNVTEIIKRNSQKNEPKQQKENNISTEEIERIVAREYGQFLQIKIENQINKQINTQEIILMSVQDNENTNIAMLQIQEISIQSGKKIAELTFDKYEPKIIQQNLVVSQTEQQQNEEVLQSSQIEDKQQSMEDNQQQAQQDIEIDELANFVDQYMLFIKQIVTQTILSQQFKQQYAPIYQKNEIFQLKTNYKILDSEFNNKGQKSKNTSQVNKLRLQKGKNDQKSKLKKKQKKKNVKEPLPPATTQSPSDNGEKEKQYSTAMPNIESKPEQSNQIPKQIVSPNTQLSDNLVSNQSVKIKSQGNTQSLTPVKIQSSLAQNSQPIESLANKQLFSQKQNCLKKKSILSSFKLEDNVYTQSRDSKFKQIGVQKQLTNQVSIQTQVPSYTEQQAVLIATNSNHKKQVEGLMINSRQFQKIDSVVDHQNCEFSGTVRNNFMTEVKKVVIGDKKVKKQVLRARIIDKIYSYNKKQQSIKFQNIINGCEQHVIKQEGAVAKLDEIYPSGIILGERSLQVELITTRFTKLLKNIEIISQKGDWLITRLFQNSNGTLKDRPHGVWLCKGYQWQCFILDDNIKIDTEGNPLYTVHKGNQMWVNILEKAVAYALGGYEQLEKVDSAKIFTLLTGCNSINVQVKEDPLKNIKILQLITECQRKNYIIHAEKNWDKKKQEKGRESIYYVLSIRRANAEEENLIELSQDTKQSFWVRLSKFVQEFSKIEILQLRINHNFAHIDLGTGNKGQISVVELDFFEEGQGCVTLSYEGESGPLKAFLYREEKSRVLKLVGQAKQKLKSSLFFQCSFSQGRYYVFAQAEDRPARLSYLGEGQPTLKITEEIHSDGLKNQVAEYLPVHNNQQLRGQRSNDMGETHNSFKTSKARLRDNFMESRLRQNFVEYVMGKSRQIPQSRIQ